MMMMMMTVIMMMNTIIVDDRTEIGELDTERIVKKQCTCFATSSETTNLCYINVNTI
jgi:hypothetical protein